MRGKHVMSENVAPLFGYNGACIFGTPDLSSLPPAPAQAL